MPELDPAVLAYYERGEEVERLRGGFPSGPLELARTQELIVRDLPAGPLDIVDVGGGPGAYAAWLADLGHQVRLIDPVPLHVVQAAAADDRVTAELGDARQLQRPDGSADVVLLLGPLYHLQERDDRLAALREAWRVLRPGGLVFAAAISRYAPVLELLVRLDRLHEPELLAAVMEAVRTGVFHATAETGFTEAYLHLPRDLRDEVAEAGFVDGRVVTIEGPGALVGDFADRWADPPRREAMLTAARLVEAEPELLAIGTHLLATARRPA